MEMTVKLPEELVTRLRYLEDQLPQILELGLREFNAQPGFKGLSEVLETLAQLPTSEEVLTLRPSEQLQHRIDTLLEKNRNEGLELAEEQEWARYEYLEHLVRRAKAHAALKRKTG